MDPTRELHLRQSDAEPLPFFFRESERLDALQEKLLPKILERLPAGASLRIWMPGCGSGENAYSLGIVLLELLEASDRRIKAEIFASDADPVALQRARRGVFRPGIERILSPERLDRFFERSSLGGYQVRGTLRNLCLFARHDVTRDAPFSRLDVLYCADAVLEIPPTSQKRVASLFNFAVNPGGVLVLPTGRSAASFREHFAALDARLGFYEKLPASPPVDGFRIQREAERFLLRDYVPTGVVVNAAGRVLGIRGPAIPGLRSLDDRADLGLEDVLEEELRIEVERGLKEVLEKNASLRRATFPFRVAERLHRVELEVRPLPGPATQDRLFIVLLEISEPDAAPPGAPATELDLLRLENADLRAALRRNQEAQRAIVERLECSNEELQTSYEEILSANDELQTLNGQLESARAELEWANGELTELNEELQRRNQALSAKDGGWLPTGPSVELPIAIVDRDLRLQRLTPGAARLLNPPGSGLSERISDCRPAFPELDLPALIVRVIEEQTMLDRSVLHQDGRRFSIRIRPYRSSDSRVDGAVLRFMPLG